MESVHYARIHVKVVMIMELVKHANLPILSIHRTKENASLVQFQTAINVLKTINLIVYPAHPVFKTKEIRLALVREYAQHLFVINVKIQMSVHSVQQAINHLVQYVNSALVLLLVLLVVKEMIRDVNLAM